jgi:myo-inositol-1(or 4)-monophosphatase
MPTVPSSGKALITVTGPLFADLDVARELALTAGAGLLEHLGEAGAVDAKAGTEFVTEADCRSEDLIVAGLRDRFPGDHILAEESGSLEGDHEAASGRTWYIDPLDGTTNFAHGYPFFAVSMACGDASGLLMGVVYAPYLDELYLAVREGGAVLERPQAGTRRVLKHEKPVDLSAALLATGFPYERDDLVDRNAGLVADFLKAPCHGVRRGGSAAVDLCHVAAGKLDGYWEFKLRAWDTAAGTLVAREAGAIVSDIAGDVEPIHTTNILAAPAGLHTQMIRILTAGGPA